MTTTHIKMPDIAPLVRYTASGSQTVYSYPFPIFASEDIGVYFDGAHPLSPGQHCTAGGGGGRLELGAGTKTIGASTPKPAVAREQNVCVYFADTGIRCGTRAS